MEVMGMRLPVYNAPARKLIELSLPWHSSTIPIADGNHSIVLGRLNKYMKDQHPAKPWGPREFFTGSGYYAHNTEGYVPRPESLVIPSRPPPAERSAKDQPFFQIMGMRLPVNNAPAKTSIGLSLPLHSSTILRWSFEA